MRRKTIEIVKRPYREMSGSDQNKVINKFREAFEDVNYGGLENALFNTNPLIWYSVNGDYLKFDAKSFIHVLSELDVLAELCKQPS